MTSKLFNIYRRQLRYLVPELSEKDVLRLYDENDYDALVISQLPLVVRIAGDLVRHGAATYASFDDLVQAGNVAVLVHVKTWNPNHPKGRSLSAWIYRNVRRAMIAENRNEGAQLLEFWDESYDQRTHIILQHEQEVMAVHQAVANAKLTRWEEVLIHEAYTQGKSVREIADEFSVSKSQVQRDKSGALKKIRDTF